MREQTKVIGWQSSGNVVIGILLFGSLLIRNGQVKNSIVVIRKELLSAFLMQLDSKPSIFETTIDNRNQLPNKIFSRLIASLPAIL